MTEAQIAFDAARLDDIVVGIVIGLGFSLWLWGLVVTIRNYIRD